MIGAYLIKTDGTQTPILPENGKKFTCKELYKLLGCDMIEFINVNHSKISMIGDEEARCVCEPVVNVRATEIYRAAWGIKDPQKAWQDFLKETEGSNVIVTGDWDTDEPYTIVGDVVICDSKYFD